LRLRNLYNDYCDDCREFHINLNADATEFKQLYNEVEKAYQKLHKDGDYKAVNIAEYKAVIDANYTIFKKALEAGVADSVIPAAMLTSLQNDVFVFSALRTHAQLYEASRMLLDENRKIKSFQKFSQDVKEIKDKFNENYLEAEYNFATSSAQMNAKWQEVVENGDRYNLQYRTAQDDKVREEHAVLANITLPAKSKFWDKYYPPNGWRCRCTAAQVRKSKFEITDEKDAIKKGEKALTNLDKDGKNRLEIFKFNPGKDKVAFPPHHPYHKVDGAKTVERKTKKLDRPDEKAN